MIPIYTQVVGAGGAATINFNNIPQTYTDLILVHSVRTNNGAGNHWDDIMMRINDDTTASYSLTINYTIGSATKVSTRGASGTSVQVGWSTNATATANSFGNTSVHFPNYTNSAFKTGVVDTVTESNVVDQVSGFSNITWANRSPITKLSFFSTNAATIVQHSSFTLYGILSEKEPKKAVGGNITTDGQYWYHTFRNTGAFMFTPNQDLSAEYLVVAGGGASGWNYSGGGGGGGVRSGIGFFKSGVQYSGTVGAGGTYITGGAGSPGSNSSFNGLVSNGGGAAMYSGSNKLGGSVGGSGGGASAEATGFISSPITYPIQGFAGGNGGASNGTGGGGGGAGGPGFNGNAGAGGTAGGNGGVGTANYSVWGLATGTGQNVSNVVYYAGGGGGAGGVSGGVVGVGGLGGGGTAGGQTLTGVAGLANTGGGAGGGGIDGGQGNVGGSGVVIIRYPV